MREAVVSPRPTAHPAERIAQFAVDCEMKYINITTRHHDSFCLFETAETDFNSVNAAAGRDLIEELATACDRRGLGLCLYYSHGRDWKHPHAPNNERTKQATWVIERLKHIKPGENAFTADLPEHLKLNVKGAKISQIYKKLDPNKPAYTITGSGGGGTHVYHWSEDRALTNRERARLQTFPDDFIFFGAKESVRRQIGMALPPLGSQIIFEAVLKCFAGMDYLSVKPNITPTGDMIRSRPMQLSLLERRCAYGKSI